MSQLMFIRMTHDENGRCRQFSSDAWQFWREYGAVVGEVLRAESPLTLSEIIMASREYALEYPESDTYRLLTDQYVAWCLFKLCDYGLAAVIVKSNTAVH